MSGNNGTHQKLPYKSEELTALIESMKRPDFVPSIEAMRKLVATVEEINGIAIQQQTTTVNLSMLLASIAVLITNNVPIPANKERGGFLIPKKLVRGLDPKGELEINEKNYVIEIRFALPKKLIELSNRMPGQK